MIDPYTFIRVVTLSLAITWSVLGYIRMIRFAARWYRRLAVLGYPSSWYRRQVTIAALRTTVLDPLNLALMLVLIGLWTVRSSMVESL